MLTPTREQRAAALSRMCEHCETKGWTHINGWNFKSPKGYVTDLSASNPTRLDQIEKKLIEWSK